MLGEPNPHLSTRTELRFGAKGALCVKIAGPKRGVWYDHSAGTGGGILALIARQTGLDRRGALAWLRDGPRAEPNATPYGTSTERQPRTNVDTPRCNTLSEWARRLWRAGRPIQPNDPAASYLLARGCTLPHPDSDLR